MKLARIKEKSRDTGRIKTYVCGVNEAQHGGELSLCGWVLWNSSIERNGFEVVGDWFEGNISKITCPECKKVLSYFRHILDEAAKEKITHKYNRDNSTSTKTGTPGTANE